MCSSDLMIRRPPRSSRSNMPQPTPLLVKQKIAIERILGGLSVEKSMVAAGYSKAYAKKSQTKFLRSRPVQEYIRARQAEMQAATMVNEEFLKNKILQFLNGDSVELAKEALKTLTLLLNKDKELSVKLKDIATRNAELKEIKQSNIVINLTEHIETDG